LVPDFGHSRRAWGTIEQSEQLSQQDKSFLSLQKPQVIRLCSKALRTIEQPNPWNFTQIEKQAKDFV